VLIISKFPKSIAGRVFETPDLNSPIPNALLKLNAENLTLANLFPNVTCCLRMYLALPCPTCRGVTRLDSARAKKRVWRPRV